MAKLTPADEKFIAKFINPNGILSAETKVECSNRFTGDVVETDEITAATIDFVFKVEIAMQGGDKALKRIHPDLKASNAVSNFDRARYIVMKLDSKTYMTILD